MTIVANARIAVLVVVFFTGAVAQAPSTSAGELKMVGPSFPPPSQVTWHLPDYSSEVEGPGDHSVRIIEDSVTFALTGSGTASSTLTGHCEYICPSTRCPQLDGYCVGKVDGACRRRYDPGQCPVHGFVKERGTKCGDGVDLGRLCTP